MEKVDLMIGAIGLVALIATGLGVALYDDGADQYAVNQTNVDLGSMGPEATSAAGTTFMFATPNNSVGATFQVDVTTSGLANPQAQVQVTIVITGPDNSTTSTIESFAFGDGSASFTLTTEDMWAVIPEHFKGTTDDVDDRTVMWDQDIEVTVVVDGPGANPLPLPSNDSYTASVSGTASAYEIVRDTPEVEAA